MRSKDLLSRSCVMVKITFCRRRQISPMMPQLTSQFAPLAYQSPEPQTHDWYSPNPLRAAIYYGRSTSQSWIDGLSQV